MSKQSGEPAAAAAISYVEFVAMVALLMALNAMAVDVILPALQQMGASLSVADENERQLPITAYVALFGASQLVYGPLSDHFGRRKVLIFGLVLYAIACVGAAFAGSFAMLLAMRAVQGIGAGATRVIAISVVRDTFGGRKMASVMSLVMMVFMAVPIVAPTIGQGIMILAGWRAILVMVAVFGIGMLVWCVLRLPETLAEHNRRPLQAAPILEAFRIVLTNRVAFAYAISTALLFGCLFAFLNSAQQIYQEIYGLGALFPVVFSSGAIFIAVASFANSRIVERLGMRLLSHGALAGFAVVSAMLTLIAMFNGGQVPFPAFYVLTTIALCLFGFIGTNFNALAMDPLGHVAGTASSVLGFLQTFVGGMIGAVIGLSYDHTVLPLSLGFLCLSAAGFVIMAVTERRRLFGVNPPAEEPS